MTNTTMHESVKYKKHLNCYFAQSYDHGSYLSAHWHRSLEVIYLLDGALDLTIENTTYCLKSNDFIIVTPKSVHSGHCKLYNHAIFIQIPYDILKLYVPNIDFIYFSNAHLQLKDFTSNIPSYMKEMLEYYTSEDEYAHLQFNKLLFALLYDLIKNHSHPCNLNIPLKTQKDFDRLSIILDYIQENYKDSLSLEDIASYAALSPGYFCRFFKKNMGITVMDYVNSVRLEHVYNDLVNTDYPVNQLLERHGFYNYKLFRKLFHEKFSTTPGALRKCLQQAGVS